MRFLVPVCLAVLACTGFARAAETLTPVDVFLGDVTINKIHFLIAADTGLYAANGLDVHQFITGAAAEAAAESGVVVPPEMIRDDIDAAPIAVGGGSPFIYDRVHAGAAHRIVLATFENIVQSHIIAAPSIHTIEDLRGKRLGYSVPGRAAHIGLLSFLQRLGWDPETDVELVARANALTDITEGRADALIAGGVLVALAPDYGLNDVVDVGSYNIPFAGSGIVVEKTWFDANRETAKRFVKAGIEALARMKTDRAAFDAAVTKWFGITDSAALDRMFAEAQDFPARPWPAVEGIELMMSVYDTPEMRAHAPEDFYDSSVMEELECEGALP